MLAPSTSCAGKMSPRGFTARGSREEKCQTTSPRAGTSVYNELWPPDLRSSLLPERLLGGQCSNHRDYINFRESAHCAPHSAPRP